MKKIAVILLPGLALLLIVLVAQKAVQSDKEKKMLEDSIKQLPTFSFMTLSGKLFLSATIEKGPVLIMNYHPDCEHCRYEISEMMNGKLLDSGVKFIFISGAEEEMQKSFLKEMEIAESENSVFLIDPARVFGKIFGSVSVPAIFIYNEKLELIRSFQGEVKIETIEKIIHEGE